MQLDFLRLGRELASDTPFQPPASVTKELLEADPVLLAQVLERALSDLELIRLKPCGFQHHRNWNNEGRVQDVCSIPIRAVSLHCGHPTLVPLKGVVETLARFELLSPGERAELLDIAEGRPLVRADNFANALEVLLQCDPESLSAEARELVEELLPAGYKLESIDRDAAEEFMTKVQVQAGESLRAVLRALKSSLRESLKQSGLTRVRQVFKSEFESELEKALSKFASEPSDQLASNSG